MNMTRFDPLKNQKSPEEWSALALNVTRENNLQWNVVGGIVLGALAASAASPFTGGLVAAYFLWDSWRKASLIQRNQAAIVESGAVAQIFDGDDFVNYATQVGHENVMAELTFAAQRNLPMSNAAADYFEDNYKPELPNALPEVKAAASVGMNTKLGAINATFTAVNTIADRYDPAANSQIDIISEMTNRITNTLIIGIPGSGKGMLVSNAIREAKRKHRNLKVFVVDPKSDPKEAGYFDSCDVVKQYACMDAKPGTVATWAESAFDEYSKYAQNHDRTLLVVDEGTMLGNKLSQAKSTLLVDKLTSYASGGDSAGRNIWFLMQSPYVSGASLNLSTTSQMTSIVIAFSENIGALSQWKSAKIFKSLSLDEVSELIDSSTTGRAIYYGKTGKWYMMPELKNSSGYNRDLREYLPGFSAPKSEKIATDFKALAHLEKSLNNSDEPQETTHAETKSGLSQDAELLLSYFDNVKLRSAKSINDLKDANKLRALDSQKLLEALRELVVAEYLTFDAEGRYLKPDWD